MCHLAVSGGSSSGTQHGGVPPGGTQNAALQGEHAQHPGVHAGCTALTLGHQVSHHLPGTHTLSVCNDVQYIFSLSRGLIYKACVCTKKALK